MYQILFHVPFTGWLFPPDGLAIPGFGVMLFLTFLLTAMVWGPRRSGQVGLSKERHQDLALVLFVTGLAGARLTYMVQYRHQFADLTPAQLVGSFFAIWTGGIVLYGSIIGGALGYLAFYRVVLRPLGISGWKVADVVAPLLALGIALGRIGCYLNGCCWGQPVDVASQPVPLSEVNPALGQFPLLPAHCRDQVCAAPTLEARLPWIHGLQTATGFTTGGRHGADPRAVVAVEPGSAADAAGLKPGDVIVRANGADNRVEMTLSGPADALADAVSRAKSAGGTEVESKEPSSGFARVTFPDFASAQLAEASLAPLRRVSATVRDTLASQVEAWRENRKGVNRLELVVSRAGAEVPLAFTPRTVPFYPTQLYETVSMLLLVWLLVEFQPYRRHDGQVLVLWMLAYAVHRFFNESIRIEPVYPLGPVAALTLSQWISVGIFAAGLAMEAYLRWAQPPLPPGPQPLGARPVPKAG